MSLEAAVIFILDIKGELSFPWNLLLFIFISGFLRINYLFIRTNQELTARHRKLHGGCQVNGPKVAKFLDR